MREPSKHLVTVYDLAPWKAGIEDFLRGKGKLSDNELVTTGNIGIVESVSGKHYLLSDEGVGSCVSLEEKNGTIEWIKEEYSDSNKTKMVAFDCLPCARTEFELKEVDELKELGKIPLHVFIRVFGSRLDENVREWNRFLSKKD